MKRFLWAALALPLALAACDLDGGEDGTNNNVGNPADGGTDANGVDWTNYQTSGTYSIFVRNNSGVDLVAFMNSLTEANKLGGVKKNSGVHGFKMNETLFSTSKDFSIIFLTSEKYAQNKGTLSSLTESPFTRIYAVYNKNGTNEKAFEISGKLGGSNVLKINNMTTYNVELRQDGPFGQTIGYIPSQQNNTTLNIVPNNLDGFFVLKQYNAIRDEIITIFPKTSQNKPEGDTWSWTANGQVVAIDAASYLGTTNLTSGAAILVIKNITGRGIKVWKGTEEQQSASGIITINNGDSRSYTILMEGSSGVYEPSYEFSGWNIVSYANDQKPIPAFTMESDYRYTITVGSGTAANDWDGGAATVPLTNPVKSINKIISDLSGPTN
jgi:hypothetical protein